ncbi:hypothetical protein AAY473_002560 [Plecturocebus cupreus]
MDEKSGAERYLVEEGPWTFSKVVQGMGISLYCPDWSRTPGFKGFPHTLASQSVGITDGSAKEDKEDAALWHSQDSDRCLWQTQCSLSCLGLEGPARAGTEASLDFEMESHSAAQVGVQWHHLSSLQPPPPGFK